MASKTIRLKYQSQESLEEVFDEVLGQFLDETPYFEWFEGRTRITIELEPEPEYTTYWVE